MGPIVYICVGLPGSGKSTFSKKLEEVTMVVRINQDELGNRRACIRKAEDSIKEGRCVIIDRCNFSVKQRKYWIDLAKKYNCTVIVEVFTTPIALCVERAKARTDHETIKIPAACAPIIKSMKLAWEDPSLDEGIDEINVRNESGKISYKLASTPPKRNLWFYVKALWSML